MIKVVNQNNEILDFLDSEQDIPKWMVYFKKLCQAEIDMCAKTNPSLAISTAVVTKKGNSFIFKGIFEEVVSFEVIEPWAP